MRKTIKKFGLLSMMFLFLFSTNSKAETWRIQAHLPSGHTVYQFIDDWVKETNVMLGGRLTLELYPAKAIIPPFETLEAVQMGKLMLISHLLHTLRVEIQLFHFLLI